MHLGSGALTTLTTVSLRCATLCSKFLLLIFLARTFDAQEVGLFGLISALVAIALPFMGLEFAYYANRIHSTSDDVEIVANIRNTLMVYLPLYGASIAIMFVAYRLNIIAVEILIPLAILAPIEHLSNEATRLLIAIKRPLKANAVLFIRAAAWVYILLGIHKVAPAAIKLETVFTLWGLFGIVSIVVALTALRKMPWKVAVGQPINRSWIVAGLKVSRPFLLAMLLGLVGTYMDRFFLSYFVGLEAVGVYTLLAGISTALHTVTNASAQAIYIPRMLCARAAHDPHAFRKRTISLAVTTLVVITTLAIVAAIAIEPFLRLTQNELYTSHLAAFRILLVGVFFRALADVPLAFLYVCLDDHSMLLTNAACFLVTLMANALLVPVFGINGAAFASVCGSVMLFLYASHSVSSSIKLKASAVSA